jgi:hypothetical protein
MKYKITVALLILFSCSFIETNAQTSILKPSCLNYPKDNVVKKTILNSLEVLFSQIKNNTIDTLLIGKGRSDFNVLKSLAGLEENKKDSIPDFYKKQLINFYQISTNEYWISLAYIGAKNGEVPILKNIINLIATNAGNKITFSLPLNHLTKTWKTKVVGNVNYHFRNKINLQNAKLFNEKNTEIATKLGLIPEKLRFYMCDNYQEISQLLGYEYDLESNGKTRDGYGVDGNNIFSIMNNEDFSHDVFHFYSGKLRNQKKGNRTVEEGIAYSWGNAYYTDSNGKMIEQRTLIAFLKHYLKENTTISLFQLFSEDPKIFNSLASEISIKSAIASLLCDEVEHRKGLEGIKELIMCGRGDAIFFETLNKLVAINQTNFDVEVKKLVLAYQK